MCVCALRRTQSYVRSVLSRGRASPALFSRAFPYQVSQGVTKRLGEGGFLLA